MTKATPSRRAILAVIGNAGCLPPFVTTAAKNLDSLPLMPGFVW